MIAKIRSKLLSWKGKLLFLSSQVCLKNLVIFALALYFSLSSKHQKVCLMNLQNYKEIFSKDVGLRMGR